MTKGLTKVDFISISLKKTVNSVRKKMMKLFMNNWKRRTKSSPPVSWE